MSLNWNWNDKMGTATDKNGYTYNLYRGNAFMIAIAEWTNKEGIDQYCLKWFFADEEHLKNCLGLAKGYEENSWKDWGFKSFKLNLNYKENHKFISLMCKAGAEVTYELYKEV